MADQAFENYRDILTVVHFTEQESVLTVFRNGSMDRHACGHNKTQNEKAKEHVEDIGLGRNYSQRIECEIL